MKTKLQLLSIAACGTILLAATSAQAGLLTSQAAAPTVGAYDIAQLAAPTGDLLNITGPGKTESGQNDGATYVAGDRTNQGQLFTTGMLSGTLTGIWVQHVGYTDALWNGTWSALNDGTALTLRIVDPSQSGGAGFVLGSQTCTVATGSGIGGGDNYWGGTGKWLYMSLDTPLTLAANTQYGFDLSSDGPYFELAGMDANQYGGGSAYTTATKGALSISTGTVYAGDRTFVANLTAVVPEPGTFAMLFGGLGMLSLIRRRRA